MTRPEVTGSTPLTKTIGIVVVDAWARKRRATASRRHDNSYAPADDIPRQRYKSIRLTIRGTEINLNVLAFDVTGFFQCLAECRHQVRVKGLAVEKSDYCRRRLLRARRERQYRRGAA
jgi:hypothetical protein